MSHLTTTALFGFLSVNAALRHAGAVSLALIAFGSGFVPIPGDIDVALVVLASHNHHHWLYYGVMSTIGSVAGGFVAYRIGRDGGERLLREKFSSGRAGVLCGWFQKWGMAAIALPAILPPPVPVVPFLIVSGALRYPAWKFVLALLAARAARFSVEAWLGARYGSAVLEFVPEHYRDIEHVAIVLLVIGVAVAVSFRIRRRRAALHPIQPAPQL